MCSRGGAGPGRRRAGCRWQGHAGLAGSMPRAAGRPARPRPAAAAASGRFGLWQRSNRGCRRSRSRPMPPLLRGIAMPPPAPPPLSSAGAACAAVPLACRMDDSKRPGLTARDPCLHVVQPPPMCPPSLPGAAVLQGEGLLWRAEPAGLYMPASRLAPAQHASHLDRHHPRPCSAQHMSSLQLHRHLREPQHSPRKDETPEDRNLRRRPHLTRPGSYDWTGGAPPEPGLRGRHLPPPAVAPPTLPPASLPHITITIATHALSVQA